MIRHRSFIQRRLEPRLIAEQTLNYGQKAFEFIEEVDHLATADEVIGAMARALAQFGFQNLTLTGLPNPKQRFEDVILAKRWPAEWFKLYTEEGYIHDDPLAHFMKRMVRPFEWDEIPYDPAWSPRANEIMQRRKDFGIRGGFVVPIQDTTGPNVFVVMSGSDIDLTARTKPALHLMALYGFYRVHDCLAPPQGKKLLLTAREREVLTWVATGKTAWEIGEILAIAKRTVDEHAQTAFHKLGAVNRTQAVAIALRDHLINF